ncbi:hypothetical protein JCGZ_00103 [Jatropha curcas]|uniref:Uncharacterized protein n=1 Tax=Jatropha curcas TaxID=180498 RepID=A0A067JWA0_JATCU|nr:hypothetical protein JCGZ_00103 [Jatropha curcas]
MVLGLKCVTSQDKKPWLGFRSLKYFNQASWSIGGICHKSSGMDWTKDETWFLKAMEKDYLRNGFVLNAGNQISQVVRNEHVNNIDHKHQIAQITLRPTSDGLSKPLGPTKQ